MGALMRPLLSSTDVDETAEAIRADGTVTLSELTELTDEFMRADAEGRVPFEVREHFSALLSNLAKQATPSSDAVLLRTSPAALEAQIEKLDGRIGDLKKAIAAEEARARSLNVQIKSRMLTIERNIASAEASRRRTRKRRGRNSFWKDIGSIVVGVGAGIATVNPFVAIGTIVGTRKALDHLSPPPSSGGQPDAELARLQKLKAKHDESLEQLRRQQSAIVTVRRALTAEAPPPVAADASAIDRVRQLRTHVDHRRTLIKSLEEELALLKKMNAQSGRFDAVLATLEAHYAKELEAAERAEQAAYEETIRLVAQLGLGLTSNATALGLLAGAQGTALSVAIKGVAGARLDVESVIPMLADELVKRGLAAAGERDALHDFFSSMLRGAGSTDREEARSLIANAGLSAAQRALLDRVFDAPDDVPVRPLVEAVLKRPEILDVRRRFVSALLGIGDTAGAVEAMEADEIRPADAILTLAEHMQDLPPDDHAGRDAALRSLAGFAKGTPAEAVVEEQIARAAPPDQLDARLRTVLDR